MKRQIYRRRLFTKEYKIGDRVAIKREEHGWHDGALEGKIISLSDYHAIVLSDENIQYRINHPRDIYKIER